MFSSSAEQTSELREDRLWIRKCSKEFYLPYYKKMNDWIHENTTWKTLKHSCGGIFPILPYLIESGFDAVNPVQCSAEGWTRRS